MKGLIRRVASGERGFTLIELLVVVAILGVIAAVVVLNVGQFIGRGNVEAANTELHQVQTAVVAAMAEGYSWVGDIVVPGDTEVEKYLLNKDSMKATYTVEDTGRVTGAVLGGPGGSWNNIQWTGSGWELATTSGGGSV